MGSRYQLCEGIVIRRNALPNGDLVVTLLGASGKWQGLAKKGGRLGGNLSRLSLFHDVTVQYYQKSSEALAVLTQVHLNGALSRLSQPQIYPLAHLMAELADQLAVDGQLGANLYPYLASALRGLCQHAKPEVVALVYAWKMVQQAGFSPSLTRCSCCGAPETGNRFDIAAGGLSCPRCNRGVALTPAVISDLKRILQATVRQALEQPPAELPPHWALLQRYLSFHVAELRSLQARYA